jgi:hypothetical protein
VTDAGHRDFPARERLDRRARARGSGEEQLVVVASRQDPIERVFALALRKRQQGR